MSSSGYRILPLEASDAATPLVERNENGEMPIEEVEQILADMEVKFAPFVRRDSYGRMGKEDIPFSAKLWLLIALGTIVPVKVVLLLVIAVPGYTICKICTMFMSPDENTRGPPKDSIVSLEQSRAEQVSSDGQETYSNFPGLHRAIIFYAGRFLSRAFLFVLGFYWIKVIQKDSEADLKRGSGVRPAAVISNHVSYIDILYHISAICPSFAPKASVARLPIVGVISKCLGCVFVQREEKPLDFKGVSGIIQKRMWAAATDKKAPLMMLFPEGTTTNGFYLLPFKTGAFLAGTPIQPVILRYPYNYFSPAWETISGVRHFILLLCQFINHLEVLWLPVYFPSEIEKADPKLYAKNVRKLMALEGGLLLSEVGLKEKRIYHSFLNEYVFKSA